MQEQELTKQQLEEAYNNAYAETHAEFDRISQEKLIISLVGSVNVGKSKTINCLTGIDYAEVKARAGSTQEVSLYELHHNVFIADTPGLHDIDETISRKASDFVEKNSDIVLFFLNASVGLTSHDKKAFWQIANQNNNIIVVVNKIDALEADELNDVLEQIKEELEITPVAISAKNNLGIDRLNSKIFKILEEKHKELLFLKVTKRKEQQVAKWIKTAVAAAAGIGAVPIPGSDIIPLTTLQISLALKIAYIYDIKQTKGDIMKLIASTITGSVGKQLTRWGITALKAVGWIPGGQLLELATSGIAATVAASLTYGFGWTCNTYYKNSMQLDLNELSSIFEKCTKDYKEQTTNSTTSSPS